MDCLTIVFVLLSTFHVMLIAVERLIAVAFPTKYCIVHSVSYKRITVSASWTSALLLAPGTYVVVVQVTGTDELMSTIGGSSNQ